MKNLLSVMVLLVIVGTGKSSKMKKGGKSSKMKKGGNMKKGGKMKHGKGCRSNSFCDQPPLTAATPPKCGGAVNQGYQNCDPMLWTPTNNSTMYCYAYGGPKDPCALDLKNDGSGMNKTPSNCNSSDKTFFLWDEPDTNGKNYTWAGQTWLNYSRKYSKQIMDMRNNQFQFTSPLMKADQPSIDIANFYAGCNPLDLNINPCEAPNNPAYINIIAVNAYCGPWNNNNTQPTKANCSDGAAFVIQNGPFSLNKVPQVKNKRFPSMSQTGQG